MTRSTPPTFAPNPAAASSLKALSVGIVGAMALFIGVAFAQEARQDFLDRSAIVTLETVVVSARRAQLPTVHIHGRRDRSADGRQIAEL